MNELVMFRVSRDSVLDRNTYEYFAGTSSGRARWTKDIDEREVVLTFPTGWVNTLVHPYSWQPSVVYCEALGLYLMANWGMGCAADGTWFAKPSYLGFWTAPAPWGPWQQVHEETAWTPDGDMRARAYQPQIAPKWIANDGGSFWLVWTDFQSTIPEEQRTEYWAAAEDLSIEARYAMAREAVPYYAFNAQRVDVAAG
jgi:hypothetical protein